MGHRRAQPGPQADCLLTWKPLVSSLETVWTSNGCVLILLHLGRTLEGISQTAADALH